MGKTRGAVRGPQRGSLCSTGALCMAFSLDPILTFSGFILHTCWLQALFVGFLVQNTIECSQRQAIEGKKEK